jgi:hypothetical protein
MSAVASELLCPSHNTGIASEVSPEWGNFLESFLRSALSWASPAGLRLAGLRLASLTLT